MDNGAFSSIGILAIMLTLSAYFSATETAFTSMNRIRLKNMAEHGSKRAALVVSLSNNYDKLLSTILIGNNIVNIASASIATALFVKNFGEVGVTIATAVTTVAVLIFGEISPKSLSKESPEKFALFSAPFIHALMILLTPINFLFSQWKKLLQRLIHSSEDRSITEEELLTLIEEAEHEGAINEDDKLLIHSVIDFNDSRVSEILTPRVDIAAIPKDKDCAALAKVFQETGYTRIPVYDGTVDKIIGIVHLRDFFSFECSGESSFADIISDVLFVHDSAKISDLLKLLQKEKCHMAIVTDEFGGTQGIITMEDILEELVGEIWDEHDEIIETIISIGNGCFQVLGSTEIETFSEKFLLELDSESSTVNGWIMEQLGKIPEKGDQFDYDSITVCITKVDHRRVQQCIVRINS